MRIHTIYIIVIILSIFLVLFALQNANPVELKFLAFKFSISLALLVILSFAMGALLSFLFSLNEFFKMKNNLRKKDKEIRQKEQEEIQDESTQQGSSQIP